MAAVSGLAMFAAGANLDTLPPSGARVVLGSPRNVRGSGAPGTVVGFVP